MYVLQKLNNNIEN